MCGRFVIHSAGDQLREAFGLGETPDIQPRFNLAITDPVPTVRRLDEGRRLIMARWGLIPRWSKDPKIGHRCFNARAESVHDKPAFREAFAERRCLVPANGWYEWDRSAKQKRPYYVHMEDGRVFAFAGVWERWRGPDGIVESVAILTTEPNALIASLHDRMPVIVEPKDYSLWLDSDIHDRAPLERMLSPYQASDLVSRQVDPKVNRVGVEGPDLIEPAAQQSLL